jgi:hypothetical protein
MNSEEANAFRQVTVQAVDPVNRLLQIEADECHVDIFVPLDCAIVSNQERVRLHFLLPGDQVQVDLVLEDGMPVARSILLFRLEEYPLAS